MRSRKRLEDLQLLHESHEGIDLVCGAGDYWPSARSGVPCGDAPILDSDHDLAKTCAFLEKGVEFAIVEAIV
jgi:hypothetical protein